MIMDLSDTMKAIYLETNVRIAAHTEFLIKQC